MHASRSVASWCLLAVLPVFLACLFLACLGSRAEGAEADDAVFSGPQVGEKLAAFKVRVLLGEQAGKETDLVTAAGGKPIALIFVHDITRPSIALTRLMMNYAGKRSSDGLAAGLVFLSGDATEMENFVKRAQHALPEGVPITLSLDGQEGPGAYGLNRKVALTVLVAKENKVTANFALVQPSVQADAPKIAKAIVDVLGGGEVPTLEQLGAQGYVARPAANRPAAKRPAGGGEQDPNLRGLLAPVINKQAGKERVDAAAKKVEEYCAEHPAARQQVGDIARRIIAAGKLQDYGTPAAQEYLRKWAKQYTAKRE